MRCVLATGWLIYMHGDGAISSVDVESSCTFLCCTVPLQQQIIPLVGRL